MACTAFQASSICSCFSWALRTCQLHSHAHAAGGTNRTISFARWIISTSCTCVPRKFHQVGSRVVQGTGASWSVFTLGSRASHARFDGRGRRPLRKCTSETTRVAATRRATNASKTSTPPPNEFLLQSLSPSLPLHQSLTHTLTLILSHSNTHSVNHSLSYSLSQPQSLTHTRTLILPDSHTHSLTL